MVFGHWQATRDLSYHHYCSAARGQLGSIIGHSFAEQLSPIKSTMTSLTSVAPNRGRLTACWHIQQCEDCVQSDHGCGWCPSSSTCIPANSLLEPVTNKHVCPLVHERFELRTRALGCNCSTTTLLSVIVTVFATMAALLLLYGITVVIVRLNRMYGPSSRHGVALDIKADGTRKQLPWKRGTSWSARIGGLFRSASKWSEQELNTERTRLLQ